MPSWGSAPAISVPLVRRALAADVGAVATDTLRWLAGTGSPPVARSGGELTDAEQPLMWAQVLVCDAASASVVLPRARHALNASVADAQADRSLRGFGMSFPPSLRPRDRPIPGSGSSSERQTRPWTRSPPAGRCSRCKEAWR